MSEIISINQEEFKKIKCEKCILRIQAKIESLGYQNQYQAIKSEGFEDDKKILKALKKNKGDLNLALQFIKEAPQKKIKKQKDSQNQSDLMETESKKCNKKCKADKKQKPNVDKEQKKNERALERKQQKLQKMIEEFPQFKDFNQKMIQEGFEDVKKNFRALKKNEGDEQKAFSHLKHKLILQNLQLCKTFSKGEIQKLYLDCNNCFFLESNFLKLAKNGNYKKIEQNIATLLNLFQSCYGSQIEIVLVFDNSKLVKDEKACAGFASQDFKLISARPQFYIADDAIVHFASQESLENQNGILYVTSDRLLQARLVEQNAKKIMTSKCFFNIMKEDFIGSKSYLAVIEN
ncbi:UBA/TS-N domain protein (macronuclear) [Tetrahymena thermophila SB210]|uniref:UBA/TS-N domain protein n=1 Tax=Tetrahymena thermophila (strain SB210) TaxID=312017 RepID=Q22YH1_TETTS|nr:UBA/TS-N domain protein [Tetrahymena thermophila SB210]EAR90314.1 UBA/TS-N domain protein [Tetrahymena thermophila SB210]|eukprot:XP_001010559.1 UBA/TS-N domain protein [Tetrahymena thermophila SB210]